MTDERREHREATEIPVTVEVLGSLTINDPEALDLSRGKTIIGAAFGSEDELLEHLAVNLIGVGHSLSGLDGWADLPDEAVTVRFGDTEARIERELAHDA